MGAVLVLTPIVVAAWPAFSAAVVAAATSLGYHVASEMARQTRDSKAAERPSSVNIELARGEVVTGQLGRDQRIIVNREGITMVFSRDPRGKPLISVTGTGQTEQELRALGEELGNAVVQQYVQQKVKDELRNRGFVVVEEQAAENRAIHIKVRHWEG